MTLSVNGAGFYTWLHQHFLGHHPYTNVTNRYLFYVTRLTPSDKIVDSLDPDVCTHDPGDNDDYLTHPK